MQGQVEGQHARSGAAPWQLRTRRYGGCSRPQSFSDFLCSGKVETYGMPCSPIKAVATTLVLCCYANKAGHESPRLSRLGKMPEDVPAPWPTERGQYPHRRVRRCHGRPSMPAFNLPLHKQDGFSGVVPCLSFDAVKEKGSIHFRLSNVYHDRSFHRSSRCHRHRHCTHFFTAAREKVNPPRYHLPLPSASHQRFGTATSSSSPSSGSGIIPLVLAMSWDLLPQHYFELAL